MREVTVKEFVKAFEGKMFVSSQLIHMESCLVWLMPILNTEKKKTSLS